VITIGEKIKLLRSQKGITQEQLASVLNLSFQAVSKWEKGAAQPDVSIIPEIANFFSVTIDELFGYKLNAMTNKERFVKFMLDTGILKIGDFILNSGKQAHYYIDTEKINTNAQLAQVGEYFADCIRDSHVEFDTIFGSVYHGISFSIAMATALYNKYGVMVNVSIGRKVSDSKNRMICGHTPKDGEKVIIVDDLISSGKSIEEQIYQIKEMANIELVAIVVIVDRRTEITDIEKKHGVKVYSIIKDEDIEWAIRNKII
jgi:orotate phosphoribosyltransferase